MSIRALATLHSPSTEHQLAMLEEVFGYKRQRDILRERDVSRRHDDAPGVSGESALSVLEKAIISRTLIDPAFDVQTVEGLRQYQIGVRSNVNGQAEPYWQLGEDIVANGYRMRAFGLDGDLYSPAGSPDFRTFSPRHWQSGARHTPGTTSLVTMGSAAWTAGTFVNDDSPTGSWALYTTSGSINDAVGPNGPTEYRIDHQPEVVFKIKMGSAITNQRVWAGLFESDPSGSSTPNLNFVGYRFHAGTDTNWIAYTGDGATRTNADTGVLVAADTFYHLRIRCSASSIKFIIGFKGVNEGGTDGTFTNIITTTLPTSTLRLAPFVRITNITSAAAVSLRFGHFQAWSR